ncbi:phage tail protein [Pelatocladus sp. BLCC-F211]|uniref:phage tail protein n=1 Tax=Pelatocladus sp. BLCC-F211 TaxID=3342752 RepID=UPI0035B7419E
MVQSRSTPSVSVQLTPMRIPEAVPKAGLAFATGETIDITASDLLLHPGEPSEMMVQIQNLEPHPLQLNLQIEGEFPTEWCQIGGMEGNEIAPGESMDAVLYFHVPATFFEDQQAIIPDSKERLKLDLRCLISIHINIGSERQYIQQEEFSLYIRPYSNYMNFLPVLYREVDFIGRLMKILELAYQPVIDSFNVMWANLDPLTAPRALLPFLAHWVAWQSDTIWDLRQQRRLIRRAVELYRWRGTRKGLRLYLHLYTGLPLDEHLANEADKHISITEPFGQPFVIGEAELGTAVLGGGQAFHFVVRLRSPNSHSIHERLIRRIIEQEKPAFSTYELFIENLQE